MGKKLSVSQLLVSMIFPFFYARVLLSQVTDARN